MAPYLAALGISEPFRKSLPSSLKGRLGGREDARPGSAIAPAQVEETWIKKGRADLGKRERCKNREMASLSS